MLKLIKLEIKKYKLLRYIKPVIIANLIILAFVLFINYSSKYESEIAMKNYPEVFTVIDTFVTVTFIIFASVLISRIVIGEYKNKTVTILFMYPIDRRKLFIAKFSIVIIFTVTTMIISNIFLGISFYFFDQLAHFIPEKLTIDMIIKNSVNIIIHAFTSAFISLISLYFGMRKKSSGSTIISASLIASIICSNGNSGFHLNSIVAVSVSLAAIGALVGYFVIKNIEHLDITN